tara:strand:- start:672 stop:998 length:327 start_codon:yes stop_codon:yes gene_type:complete
MQIQLKGIVRGALALLNSNAQGKALRLTKENFTQDEIRGMVDNTSYVAIYVKSQAEEATAVNTIKQVFPDFAGDLVSKATSNGNWFVGQAREPKIDDSSFLLASLSSK